MEMTFHIHGNPAYMTLPWAPVPHSASISTHFHFNFDRPTSLLVRFQELAQVWAISHSPMLDLVSGTTCRFVYMILNLLLYLSIYLSIYLFICLFIYLFIHQSTSTIRK